MPENIAYAEPSVGPSRTPGDEPARRECLRCYLVRMIRAYGCDNTKQWTLRWRDRRAPGDGQLIEQLEERGGICCDCEVIFNVWQQEESDWQEGAEDDQGDAGDSRRPPACSGTSGGDPLVPCARWQGWSVSDPYDPDDDDDYGDVDEEEPW
jgi:hypothetical protein